MSAQSNRHWPEMPWDPWFLRHPFIADALLGAAVLFVMLLEPRHGLGFPDSRTAAGLSVAAACALILRRRLPFLVLVATTGCALAYVVAEGVKSPIGVAIAVAIYTLVVKSGRRVARTITTVVVMVVMVVATTIFTDGDVLENLSVSVLTLLGAAMGEAVLYRRAYEAELAESLQRAEEARAEEARGRTIQERLRLAHELHDVIAHHIALMNVQAGVASHFLRDRPEEAERALAEVRNGGRTVLTELTILLGVLRRSEDHQLPTAPMPTLQELGALIDSFRAAGLQVEWTPQDGLQPLPELVELTAYRVIQESLTNVVKHAPGSTARVELTQAKKALTVTVTNSGGTAAPSSTPSGTGHGLLGMRERVQSVGGQVNALPVGTGGFQVQAVLPICESTNDQGEPRDDPGVAGRRPDTDPARVPRPGRLCP
ncbi:sensor histidine kinase [Kribbella deserti]|uniref:histidine kinase n=1 Tax=Kribbella deserti TaxID=1926257 RepID=A0ABV6QGP7_9ACTN